MPRRAKRLRLQPKAKFDAATSLDPLKNLTSHVHDHIFQHLSGSEIIKCTTVSSSWNYSLSVSSQAMSKIKLVLNDEKSETFPRGKAAMINRRKRQYKNAEVTFRSVQGAFKNILWKISGSLENIQVDGNYGILLKNPLSLKFPKLKILKLANFQAHVVHSMLSCTSDRLLELKIETLMNPFYDPIPPMTAKLTSLDISKCRMKPDKSRPFLKEFLRLMRSSLKFLSINSTSHDVFDLILGEMEVLEFLSVSYYHIYNASETRNRTITTVEVRPPLFTFGAIFFDNEDNSVNIMRQFENLQKLQMHFCDISMLEDVLRELRSGVEVEIGVWRGNLSPQDVYQRLMESDESVARNITFVRNANRIVNH
jgi:hypothetical protein